MNQYLVLLKPGPKWLAGKPLREQPLLNHARYLYEQMTKGVVQIAGPFLDGSGGLVVVNSKNETDVRAVAEHDPGVMDRILEVESIRPFYIAFDAATGKNPFKK